MNITGLNGHINGVKLQRIIQVGINGLATLTGCLYKKMYGRFAGTKKVAVIMR